VERFYYVPDWQSGLHIPAENVLISAATLWHKTRKKFTNPNFLPRTTKRIFIDSGGFTFLTKWEKYPFTIDEFIDFLGILQEKQPIEQVAILDYPCEPDVNRSEYKTNFDRIRATVENAVVCFDKAPEINWIPVIQGYYLHEYLDCLSLYEERGIKSEKWAIGSVCQRRDIAGPRKIITRLKKTMSNKKLHAFGISIRLLKDLQIWNSLFSSDSASWQLYGGFAYTIEEKLQRFQDFTKELDSIRAGFEHQSSLEAFNYG
jgi:hypothetical protein